MSLLITLKDAQKDAMRAKDKQRLNPIRMVLAAIKQREIDEQITLDDAGITSVIVKLVKQRRDSYTQYKDAGRDDLAEIEANEITALETFLPQQLSDEEIIALIGATFSFAFDYTHHFTHVLHTCCVSISNSRVNESNYFFVTQLLR